MFGRSRSKSDYRISNREPNLRLWLKECEHCNGAEPLNIEEDLQLCSLFYTRDEQHNMANFKNQWELQIRSSNSVINKIMNHYLQNFAHSFNDELWTELWIRARSPCSFIWKNVKLRAATKVSYSIFLWFHCVRS